MSISEYAQIMKETGIMAAVRGSGADGTIGDSRIQVEHVFVFDTTERWEKLCKGTILGLLNLGRHVVDSIRILTMAGSAALIFWGCSQLVLSIQNKTVKQDDRSDHFDPK